MTKLICIKGCILAVALCCCFVSQAQKSHSVYGEILGNGLFYSVNYEYRFPVKERKWGVKTGLAPYSTIIYSIIQGNFLWGKESHYLEVGLGATILTGFGSEAGNNQIAANGALQYRYMSNGGFLFRLGLSPVFVPIDENDTFSGLNKVFWIWPSMSFGYTF